MPEARLPPDALPPEASPDAPPVVAGLSALAEGYDALILDLWGVLHDGVRPYPGAIDCLRQLRRVGKRVCLLSNAPRRIGSAVARLDELGITADLYDSILTSGELAHQALRRPDDAFHAALGRRCLHLGPPRDDDVHQGLGLDMAATPEDADFVLVTGVDTEEETLADSVPVLARAGRRDLPMVCANPDLVVMFGGSIMICAGLLARHYEEMGGRVAYHGKPYPAVYRHCLDRLGGMPPGRVLAVGDALRTDIAGANAAGIDSLWITGGIHLGELGTPWGAAPDPARAATAIAVTGFRPTAVAPCLAW